MSTHRRKQIRDAVVARLTGLTTTGARVYGGRTLPLDDNFSPTLFVYARSERSRFESMGTAGRTMARQVKMAVHGYVSLAATDPEDTLDLISLEVERAMMTDETFGALRVTSIELSETDISADINDARRRLGEIRLTYDIEYATAADDPSRSG